MFINNSYNGKNSNTFVKLDSDSRTCDRIFGKLKYLNTYASILYFYVKLATHA